MASTSAKFREALRDDIPTEETRLRALTHERQNGCGEGRPERRGLDRGDVGILESSKGLSGEVIVTTGLHCG
jgi:hypothetical protein